MATPHSGAAPHILIADDDDLVAAVLASALQSHGYRVTCAPKGRVSSAEPNTADLVILDAHVPGQDFHSTLARLQAQSIPVLIVSGENAPPREAPAQSFLGKPVDLDELLETVARILSTTDGD